MSVGHFISVEKFKNLPLVAALFMSFLLGCRNDVAALRVPASDPHPDAAGPEREASSAVTITVILPGGRRIMAEVADDPEKRQIGLMYRSSLPTNGGMLLVFPVPGRQGIWMKNCLIPLDLLWLDEKGKVLAVKESAPPCSREPCDVYDPNVLARSVLELGAGTAHREGLRVGSVLQIIAVTPLAPR